MKSGDYELADLINRAMDLPLDWAYSNISSEIPAEVLLEFSRICREIAGKTMDHKFHAAVSFMWLSRKYVGITHYNRDDFVGTEISSEQSKKLMQAIEWSIPNGLNVIAKYASKSPNLSAILMSEGREEIFEVFLNKERIILREFGLNQSTVEIIIDRLRSFELQAFLNIVDPKKSVNPNSITKACAALYEISRPPVAIHSRHESGRMARSSGRRRLSASKDKIVGIATLFGDTAPLLIGASFDVTSYISTALGATAMALLPRGLPRKTEG